VTFTDGNDGWPKLVTGAKDENKEDFGEGRTVGLESTGASFVVTVTLSDAIDDWTELVAGASNCPPVPESVVIESVAPANGRAESATGVIVPAPVAARADSSAPSKMVVGTADGLRDAEFTRGRGCEGGGWYLKKLSLQTPTTYHLQGHSTHS